jgi:predicted O-methyltransferase YrrM
MDYSSATRCGRDGIEKSDIVEVPMLANLTRRTLVRTGLWYAGLLKPQTQTTTAERAAIARHAAGRSRLVEIGVFNGVTSLEIRRAMAADGLLWAVDPFPPGRLGYCIDERVARHTIKQSNNGEVLFVRLTGAVAAAKYAEQMSEPVDFIFIDGDHSWDGIKADWQGWSPLMRCGGIVALHDSRLCPGREVPADSVRYTQQVIRLDPHFEIIDEVDSLTVFRANRNIGGA